MGTQCSKDLEKRLKNCREYKLDLRLHALHFRFVSEQISEEDAKERLNSLKKLDLSHLCRYIPEDKHKFKLYFRHSKTHITNTLLASETTKRKCALLPFTELMKICKRGLRNMPYNKYRFSYDDEYDTLTIYSPVKKASHGIEWGNIDVSYDSKGKLVGLQFNHASSLLTDLTKRKVIVKELNQLSDCKLLLKERAGILYVNFKFYFESGPDPLEDTLTVKSLSNPSPITAS